MYHSGTSTFFNPLPMLTQPALVVHKSEQAFGSYTIKQLPGDDVFVTRRLSGTTRLPLHTTVGAFTVQLHSHRSDPQD